MILTSQIKEESSEGLGRQREAAELRVVKLGFEPKPTKAKGRLLSSTFSSGALISQQALGRVCGWLLCKNGGK